MKKIIAMLLSLAMLLACAAGLAETVEKTDLGTVVNVNEAFRIRGKIPEGYRLSILNQNQMFIRCRMTSEDAKKPTVDLSIAFSEDWADTERLNDVSDEDLAEIEASFQEEDEVSIEYRETGMGTKLMVVTESKDDIDYAAIYTIYKGYELEFVMEPGEEPLTEENIQMLVDFITEIEFY